MKRKLKIEWRIKQLIKRVTLSFNKFVAEDFKNNIKCKY